MSQEVRDDSSRELAGTIYSKDAVCDRLNIDRELPGSGRKQRKSEV
ncbi:hypothetical protein V1224_06580 [Lachnospiraceae bacterium JLR.KK008]